MTFPQSEDYQIGWIYALSLELNAARVFLDEEYPKPEYAAQNDRNSYTLGRMGKHDVVMAGLPAGQIGNSSAAAVVRDMVRSYPNLRFVLMVGIGGGVPEAGNDLNEEDENEIHLGDVIVSTPSGRHGAVIQYDFGKEHQANGFELTGYLNLPPGAILAAITTLQSDHDLNGTDSLADRIEERLNSNARWRKLFGRPKNASDMLFSSDYVHIANSPGCGGCDEVMVVRRGRETEDQVPRVHYGVVASGNRVMRDAKRRDILAKEQGIICFEMEAAGLMNSCPCLVIRGICDYADSHKTKVWQRYSALTAASYAWELLDQITPQSVGGDSKVLAHILNDG